MASPQTLIGRVVPHCVRAQLRSRLEMLLAREAQQQDELLFLQRRLMAQRNPTHYLREMLSEEVRVPSTCCM